MSETVWHENDEFWATMAPWFFGEDEWGRADTEVDQVGVLLSLEPGASILDLCCGPGRHSLALARKGFAVTGVDRTVGYLETVRQKAEAEGLEIELVQEDMRRFCRPGAFDAAINLCTSFGYFENPDDDRQVLTNVRASLREQGAFVMQMSGKEILARIFRKRDWVEKDGAFILEERKVTRDWAWIENRWIIIDGTDRNEYRVNHRIYSAAELSALLGDVGFSTVSAYGDLAGAPYDHTAKHLVVVARK